MLNTDERAALHDELADAVEEYLVRWNYGWERMRAALLALRPDCRHKNVTNGRRCPICHEFPDDTDKETHK